MSELPAWISQAQYPYRGIVTMPYHSFSTIRYAAHGNPSAASIDHTKGARMGDRKTYEILFEDGTKAVANNVDSHNLDEGFLILWGREEATGNSVVVGAYNYESVRSFRNVPEQEKPLTPKHRYRLTLSDGAHKEVQADMYRVSLVGDTQIYEFFSRISARESREELTVPFSSVKFVERVDHDVPAIGQVNGKKAKTEPQDMPVPEAEDFIEAVRPKKI